MREARVVAALGRRALAVQFRRAQLLMRRVQDPQQLQWLRVIERSALDGAQTVRRLQEFTRIRRDQPMVPLDITQVVRDALDITQSRWREEPASRGVVIDVRTDEDFAADPRLVPGSTRRPHAAAPDWAGSYTGRQTISICQRSW